MARSPNAANGIRAQRDRVKARASSIAGQVAGWRHPRGRTVADQAPGPRDWVATPAGPRTREQIDRAARARAGTAPRTARMTLTARLERYLPPLADTNARQTLTPAQSRRARRKAMIGAKPVGRCRALAYQGAWTMIRSLPELDEAAQIVKLENRRLPT